MKFHVVAGASKPLYSRTVASLWDINGTEKICAPVPLKGLFAAMEGNVVHARTSNNEGVSVIGLMFCSGVFYCYYSAEMVLTDVVAFHSPSGTLKLRGALNGHAATFGDPAAEAAHYQIGYATVKVILVNGPNTMAAADRTRKESFERAVNGELDLITAQLNGLPIFLYDNAEIFGISGQGHAGEPGSPPKEKDEDESAKGCCYLTTATMLALDKPDDCPELTALRSFRDSYMRATVQGRADIARYYRTAPLIVRAISATPDCAAVYADLYARMINPAVVAIRDGNYRLAYAIYATMVDRLEREYL